MSLFHSENPKEEQHSGILGAFSVDNIKWEPGDEAGASLGADEAAAATDDAGLVEAIGGSVQTVAGDERSMKVTRPLDLALAQILAAE